MDYQSVIKEGSQKTKLTQSDRFVKISQREDRSDLAGEAWSKLFNDNFLHSWKGMILNKSVTELGIYTMLLQELQPKTIIEIGALNGGSAVWLSDTLKILGVRTSIYSVDTDLTLLNKKAEMNDRIQFLEGDCKNMEDVLPGDILADLPHPWLVIEDVNLYMTEVLEYINNNDIKSGDYVILENTNPFYWENWPQEWANKDEITKGMNKIKELRAWLEKHEDEYLIDTYYTDMYGYNVSKNWNSILKKA